MSESNVRQNLFKISPIYYIFYMQKKKNWKNISSVWLLLLLHMISFTSFLPVDFFQMIFSIWFFLIYFFYFRCDFLLYVFFNIPSLTFLLRFIPRKLHQLYVWFFKDKNKGSTLVVDDLLLMVNNSENCLWPHGRPPAAKLFTRAIISQPPTRLLPCVHSYYFFGNLAARRTVTFRNTQGNKAHVHRSQVRAGEARPFPWIIPHALFLLTPAACVPPTRNTNTSFLFGHLLNVCYWPTKDVRIHTFLRTSS